MTSQRLTEEVVHAACADIVAQGERPTALKLLNYLGRGSLTTISKYLNSWNSTEEAQTLDVNSLPTVVQLPEELTKDGEELLKKIWNVAKSLADAELEKQREGLKQAEKEYEAELKKKDSEIRSLDMQVHKLQTSLDSISKSHDQLKTDLKSKDAGLSKFKVELEKLRIRYESSSIDLVALKKELNVANKAASDAEKMVSKLEGQMEVYKLFEKKAE